MRFYNDDDVLRYVDGIMDDDTAKQITEQTQIDPDLSTKIDAAKVSKLPFSKASINRPMPATTNNAKQPASLQGRETSNSLKSSPPRGKYILHTLIVSSAICLSFLLGFAASKLTENTALFNSVQLDDDAADSAWVQRIADFQALYGENTVSTLEGDFSETGVKLGALTTSSGIAVHIPDLTEHGYNFVRAQELVYEDKPLIQLMYKSKTNKPLALSFMVCVGPTRLSLRFARHEDLTSARWRLPNQRLVVMADEPLESLEQIAHQIQKVHL